MLKATKVPLKYTFTHFNHFNICTGGEGEDEDIVEEALNTFRANTFYRNFEIKGPADRTLVYCYLYIADCLSKISTLKSPSLVECTHQKIFNQVIFFISGTKTLTNHATASFAIPGDGNFPLNALFSSPSSKQESGT